MRRISVVLAMLAMLVVMAFSTVPAMAQDWDQGDQNWQWQQPDQSWQWQQPDQDWWW